MDESKTQLKWRYEAHKNKLTRKERALLALYVLDDWNIGQIAKFTRVPAPVIKYRLGQAIEKIWW